MVVSWSFPEVLKNSNPETCAARFRSLNDSESQRVCLEYILPWQKVSSVFSKFIVPKVDVKFSSVLILYVDMYIYIFLSERNEDRSYSVLLFGLFMLFMQIFSYTSCSPTACSAIWTGTSKEVKSLLIRTPVQDDRKGGKE